ncbi:MAG: MFS transporter [Bacteroidota bacterium]
MLDRLAVYSKKFWTLSICYFFFMISFNMLVPELDEFLTDLGGKNYLGWILGIFAFSSLICRPLSGKLTDTIGRVPIIILGSGLNLIFSVFYLFVVNVPQFLWLRFGHGISAGFQPTGLMAYLADIIPQKYRGEAMGLIGVFISSGIALGQPLGSEIANNFGTDALFYTGIAFAIIAFFMVLFLKETLEERQKFQFKLLKISRSDLFDFDVFYPFLLMFFIAFMYGDFLTIIPDYSSYLGIENQGLFFSYFVFASIIVRFFFGAVSDRIGRIKSLKIGAIFTIIGMIGFLFVTEKILFFTVGTVLGIGAGIISPTLIAFTVDLSKAQNRGKAMSTYFIGLEGGIAVGAFLTGYLYNNNLENIQTPIYLAFAAACIGLLLLFSSSLFGIRQTD